MKTLLSVKADDIEEQQARMRNEIDELLSRVNDAESKIEFLTEALTAALTLCNRHELKISKIYKRPLPLK